MKKKAEEKTFFEKGEKAEERMKYVGM